MFRPDPSKLLMKDPATASARIYIGNLNENVVSADVETHFSKYGKILGVLIHRGFGFIQFEKEQSASDAINMEHQNIFHGRNLVVRHAQSNAGSASSGGNAQDNSMRAGRNTETGPFNNRGGGESGRGRGRGIDIGRTAHRGIAPTGRGGRGSINADRDRSPLENRDKDDWRDNSGYYSHHTQLNNSFPKNAFNSSGAYNTDSSNVGLTAPVKPPVDRNDCEIIVVSKALTEYAEFIEEKLKQIGITVDLLFPNEDVPIGRVLANISSRGCLYAILVMPQNEEHQSLTLNILHGLQQEHRNMPLSDSMTLIKNDFEAYCRGDKSNTHSQGIHNFGHIPLTKDRHPESIQTLVNILADNRTLTVLQYDKLIRYLQERREVQVKLELGDASDVPIETAQTKTQQELQQRILSILNKPAEPVKNTIPDVSTTPQWSSPQAPSKPAAAATPLLHDPTVQKALDSLMQGNLLQNITGANRFS